MLKYIMTTNCPRKCEYCISRNVAGYEESLNDNECVLAMQKLYRDGYKDIMLTGGEPTVAKKFFRKLRWAGIVFDTIHIVTQNKEWLVNNDGDTKLFDSIVFSRHGEADIPYVGDVESNVYLSILEWEYSPEVIAEAYLNGYAGVSIQENNFGSDGFAHEVGAKMWADAYGLSLKINREGHCVDDATPIMLPDYTVVDSFKGFM